MSVAIFQFYSTKVFKERLVIVSWGTRQSTGKIIPQVLENYTFCNSTLGMRKYD